jgi:P4 family phage/plasmid primase-like protien
MENFITENKINHLRVSVQMKNDKKEINYPKGWAKMNLDEIKNHNEKNKNHNMYALLFADNVNIMVFDTDTEEAYNGLVSILKDLDIYNENSITESFSGRTKNLYFKRHFYFKVKNHDKMKNEMNIKYLGFIKGLDIFYNRPSNVLEWNDTVITDVPIITHKDFREIKEKLKNTENSSDSEEEEEIIEKKEKKEKKQEKQETEKEDENLNEIGLKNKINNDTLRKIIFGLNKNRFDDYTDWLTIAMIFINENLNLNLFIEASKRSKKYNEENNNKIINSLKNKSSGFTVSTLYFWLKVDNIDLFNELKKERSDFWNLMINFNQNDLAKFYYNYNPYKYVKCNIDGWYEYKDNNILLKTGEAPPSLLNDISNVLQNLIIEQRNLLKPNEKYYEKKNKLITSSYKQTGNSKFISGVIDYLENYYTIQDLYKYVDNNKNLIAFNNRVYDISIYQFRDIKPNDFISRTTGYNINLKKNESIRKELDDLLLSIFNNCSLVEYYKYITSLSLFGNKNQILYIHTGNGSNGKSLLGDFLKVCLGDYFYNCDNNFLTNNNNKSGGANSTLANAKGKRYLSIQEPENEYFNTEFIKYITGQSEITTRELYKSNTTFNLLFTPHLQCNNKPKLNKIDGGIIRRLKIIPYPNKFVDTPKNPNEKLKDKKLLDKLKDNQNYINEFMLMLLESAEKYSKIDLNETLTPIEVINETKEYLDDNNPLKYFIDNYLIITNNLEDKIKSSDLYTLYCDNAEETPLSSVNFAKYMKVNNIISKKISCTYYLGIKIKE